MILFKVYENSEISCKYIILILGLALYLLVKSRRRLLFSTKIVLKWKSEVKDKNYILVIRNLVWNSILFDNYIENNF